MNELDAIANVVHCDLINRLPRKFVVSNLRWSGVMPWYVSDNQGNTDFSLMFYRHTLNISTRVGWFRWSVVPVANIDIFDGFFVFHWCGERARDESFTVFHYSDPDVIGRLYDDVISRCCKI